MSQLAFIHREYEKDRKESGNPHFPLLGQRVAGFGDNDDLAVIFCASYSPQISWFHGWQRRNIKDWKVATKPFWAITPGYARGLVDR